MILFLYNTTMIVPVFAQQKTAVCIRPKSNIASYEKTRRSMIVLEKRENMYRFVILFLIEEMTAAQS